MSTYPHILLRCLLSFTCLLPVLLSSLLLAAHFLRSNNLVLTAICLGMLLLLLIRRRWAAIAVQVFLLIGAAEWLRTLVQFIEVRQAMGLPWMRLLFILGGVFAFTALAALVFELPPLRRRYQPIPPSNSAVC